MMDKIQEAIRLQAEGLKIVPCKGKVPLIKYREIEQLTREQIYRFFSEPACDVAIECTNVLVLDSDTPEGTRWLSENAITNRIVKTRRGFHYHFQGVDYPSRQNLLGLGIDVRSNGALAMIPFSEGYEWVLRGKPGTADDLLPKIEEPKIRPINAAGCEEMVRRTQKYLERVEGAVAGKGGHSVTFRVACIIAERLAKHMTPEQALPIIQEWNQKCQPMWADKELIHKLEDAWRRVYVK